MTERRSDAIVVFGAGGDLAAKMLFPALYALHRKGRLGIPVIGVSRGGWNRAHFAERVRATVGLGEQRDARELDAFSAGLRYVDGDLRDARTFERIAVELKPAQRPLHYLALPPALFAATGASLARLSGVAASRVAVEKPFGHDLASARALDAALRESFDEGALLRVDHYLAKEPVQNLLYLRRENPVFEPLWNREHVRRVQITMAESFGIDARGSLYDALGAVRDVVQNHLMQALAMVAMDVPAEGDAEAMHEQRARLLEAVHPAEAGDVVRGQYLGYREVEGVAADSDTETFAALRLHVAGERWRGVPFWIRAGKRLPVTATEVVVEIGARDARAPPNAFRFRLGPGRVGWALEGCARHCGRGMQGTSTTLEAGLGADADSDAYERLLDAALRGERSLFERQRAIEAAWRIVDPLQSNVPPAEPYEPGSWGPASAQRLFGAWHNPRP
jgi:glucose-6-phosphate 1-dehydrogenase